MSKHKYFHALRMAVCLEPYKSGLVAVNSSSELCVPGVRLVNSDTSLQGTKKRADKGGRRHPGVSWTHMHDTEGIERLGIRNRIRIGRIRSKQVKANTRRQSFGKKTH